MSEKLVQEILTSNWQFQLVEKVESNTFSIRFIWWIENISISFNISNKEKAEEYLKYCVEQNNKTIKQLKQKDISFKEHILQTLLVYRDWENENYRNNEDDEFWLFIEEDISWNENNNWEIKFLDEKILFYKWVNKKWNLWEFENRYDEDFPCDFFWDFYNSLWYWEDSRYFNYEFLEIKWKHCLRISPFIEIEKILWSNWDSRIFNNLELDNISSLISKKIEYIFYNKLKNFSNLYDNVNLFCKSNLSYSYEDDLIKWHSLNFFDESFFEDNSWNYTITYSIDLWKIIDEKLAKSNSFEEVQLKNGFNESEIEKIYENLRIINELFIESCDEFRKWVEEYSEINSWYKNEILNKSWELFEMKKFAESRIKLIY